ncbi:MAG: hypothetical protein OEM82_11885 [Acidobacteriota bacterium]|nr:hypothetical protein [Acidobacteriota bacterium]MDH3528387.1 hypothetical protein [Acidobacteriota bacterium]
MKISILLLIAAFGVTGVPGQSPKPLDGQDDYEANAAYPFGRLNPEAPPETKQFSFIVGVFDCKDRILNPADGKWYDMTAVRRAEYVLNGHAIQDKNYTNILTSTNIRIFDPVNKHWVVSYFKAPFGVGVWKGAFSDSRVELTQGDEKNGSRLSFFDYSEEGYNWKGESVKEGKASPFWEFRCTRRKSH